MNEGKMEYVKFGRAKLNNRVSLSYSNIFQRAHQWACFRMKKYLGVTHARTLFHICKSGQFYPNPTWVILLRSMGMDVRRAVSIWKIMMNSHDIEMEDISNVIFDIVSRSPI